MKPICLSKMSKFLFAAFMLTVGAAVSFGCRSTTTQNQVKITVTGDANVIVGEPKSFTVASGSKWAAVKNSIKVSAKTDYELSGWKLGSAAGADIADDHVFTRDTTVFAVSKRANERTYKVRHLQQNIDNDDYTQAEEETKLGIIDENTAAEAKDYTGFTKPEVTQQKVKADNSTVVDIKYDRKIITLNFDLKGGSTAIPLEGDALKGKFGAAVKIETPTKDDYKFDGWEPELPKTFTLESDNSTYTAKWRKLTITVKADERLQVTVPAEGMNVNFKTTWATLKADITSKVTLNTAEWSSEYYEIYQWRIGDAAGAKLTDEYVFEQDTTIYAVSNYRRFTINGNHELTDHDGTHHPKGTIYIPETVTKIGEEVFSDCDELTSIILQNGITEIGNQAFQALSALKAVHISDTVTKIGDSAFNGCNQLAKIVIPDSVESIGDSAFAACGFTNIVIPKKLTSIGASAFAGCTELKTFEIQSAITQLPLAIFANCEHLESISIPGSVTEIGRAAFNLCSGLKEIDIPNNVSSIAEDAFLGCRNAVITLPENITDIKSRAFGSLSDNYCKRVLVKSDAIKQMVIASGYPEAQIEIR